MSYDDFDYDRDGGPDRCDCPDVWTQLFGEPGPPMEFRDYLIVGFWLLIVAVVFALLILVVAPVMAA